VKRTIYAASSSCYGIPDFFPTPETAKCDPRYPYALTKYLGEQIFMHWSSVYRLNVLSLRLFNVYGPRQPLKGQYAPVIGIFQRQKKSGTELTIVGDGEQRRDFTHVSDVVNANIIAAFKHFEKWQTNGAEQWIYQFGQIYNIGTGINYSINEIAKMLNHPTVHIPPRLGESRVTLANISKIKRELGWEPKVSLESWLKENDQ
jgi:UDP-glucose 4-epimerase